MKKNWKKSDHTFNDKVGLFRENIVVIEEEWFSGMNLAYGETFPMALIKREKSIINKKTNPRDTKWHIWEIIINSVWNTQISQILREKQYGKFLFRVNFLRILINPVELSHEWDLMNFKYQEPEFYSRSFDEQ